MPDALFFIDQQIKTGIYQIRHIGRRNDGVIRRSKYLVCSQCAQSNGDKVVLIPRPEESTGANHESRRHGCKHTPFRFSLSEAVVILGVDLVGLNVWPRLRSSEY